MIRVQSTDKLKAIEVEIMQEVHNFCEKNCLTYTLWGGSLLGAIRHNGFIPWDDDIDIAMPRKDYIFFIEHFNNAFYGVKDCFTCSGFPYTFAKVYDRRTLKIENCRNKCEGLGIDVDVFPLDYYGDIEEIKKSLRKRKVLRNRILGSNIPYHRASSMKWILRNIAVFTERNILHSDTNAMCRKINEMGMKYNDGGGLMIYSDTNVKSPLFMKKSWFMERKLHCFENTEYYIPDCADNILTIIYGDYMKLPPEDQRVPHHDFEAYII